MTQVLPSRAQVVVVGGGVVGCSVAYHLTKRGWRDVVLLERKSLTSGTTWHAAGLITLARPTHGTRAIVQRSLEVFQSLEAETGLGTGFRRTGTLHTGHERRPVGRAAASGVRPPVQRRRGRGGGRRPRSRAVPAVQPRGPRSVRCTTRRTVAGTRPTPRWRSPRARARAARRCSRTSPSPTSPPAATVSSASAPSRATSRRSTSSTARACGAASSAPRPASTCRCRRWRTTTSSPTTSPTCRPTCRPSRARTTGRT